jgi:hypothetical protein
MRIALVTLAVLAGLSATYAQEHKPAEAPPPAQQREQGTMGGMGMMGQMSRMMENCNKMMESRMQQRQQAPQNR